MRTARGRFDGRFLFLSKNLFALTLSVAAAGNGRADEGPEMTLERIVDSFFEFGLSPWDTAAGALLVTEAGGVVTDFEGGTSWRTRGIVLAATPGVHAALLEVVREIGVAEKDL
jgi:Inositol monophosphatase family